MQLDMGTMRVGNAGYVLQMWDACTQPVHHRRLRQRVASYPAQLRYEGLVPEWILVVIYCPGFQRSLPDLYDHVGIDLREPLCGRQLGRTDHNQVRQHFRHAARHDIKSSEQSCKLQR